MTGRYHIPTAPAPAPFAYPAAFHLLEHDDYVKYGYPVFEGRSARGDTHWTAEVITQTWYQAETGRIPISGAGYGGPFAGEGFDGIWLDMSEIVRPTRDGIHGRETISTTVDLGRRLPALFFDDAGRLTSALPSVVQLPWRASWGHWGWGQGRRACASISTATRAPMPRRGWKGPRCTSTATARTRWGRS
jgi:hypothetical protein